MIADISKALTQIFDRRFFGVLLKSVLLTALLLGALIALAIWAMGYIPVMNFTIPFTGYQVTFLDQIVSTASFGLILVMSMFLMFPVAAVFVGLFLDEIADAVEARYYPHLPPPRRQGWGEIITQGAGFALVLIGANLLALIVYIMSTALAPFVFWIVNGYLLGREYFEVVAMRRMDEQAAKALRRRHLPSVWIAGTLLAAPLSVPVLNIIAPLIGVAAFVHLYHRRTAPRETAADTRRSARTAIRATVDVGAGGDGIAPAAGVAGVVIRAAVAAGTARAVRTGGEAEARDQKKGKNGAHRATSG
ncbi:MAG: EI24 domain-containing protein [Paracoccaceae bacterium]